MYDLHSIHAQLQDKKSPLFRTEQKMIHCLYCKMDNLQGNEDPLFLMWQNELEFTYGNLSELLSQNSKINPQELCELYGFENSKEVNLSQLLKCIQTFYSVLIKLITYNMVQGTVPKEKGDTNDTSIESILSGKAFVKFGINNYSYDDWFSWILKYWDSDIEEHCCKLRTCLEAENTILSIKGFIQSFRSDSLKHIYETVIPKEIRHALGEYYTPDWLATCTIKNALNASKEKVTDLRFIDPTCGAGTFLTRVMRMIQAESLNGFINPSMVAGFDINSLAVLTAKANYLATIIDQISSYSDFVIPVYHYDIINTPALEGDKLIVDTNCDLICEIPRCICKKAEQQKLSFCADDFLQLICQHEDCAELRKSITHYDSTNQKIIANILLNRIFAFYERKADIVVGNPPWVNWEYLPQKYKAKSQHLWPEYGLFNAKGRDLSFSKEDISILVTYVVIDRFLNENGYLSFVLRQAMFKSAQNGVGFRRFKLEKGDTDYRVLQVDDLCGVKPFEGINSRSALVLIKKNEKHTFPVPYNCWTRRKHFLKATREPDATADSIMTFVDVEKMIAFPADKNDPSSIWINSPERITSVIDTVLGSNSYKARTGVFTGGANAVYWMNIAERSGETIKISNIVERAKRKVKAVTAEIEPVFVYPLVQGSDISQWNVNTKSYILCPHTAETKMYPVAENVLSAVAPKTLDYLAGFREDLDARKGFAGWEKEIQAQHFYSILRIGEYTFSKYKVAWRYIAQSFITAVITSAQDSFVGEKLYIPNEKIMYVGTDCKSEAYYLCGVLSSSPVSYCVKCYMNPTSISAHVLDKLNIPQYDPNNILHQKIATICETGHQAKDSEEKAKLQTELDTTIGELYGISDESIKVIQDALRNL